MVTQATAEQTTGKRGRGRPPRIKEPQAPAKATGERGTDFQRLVKAHKGDTIVRAFMALRRKLFNEGEPVDQMTASIKRRIVDLQGRGNTLH